MYINIEVPNLKELLDINCRTYLDKAESIVIDITLIIIHPYIVRECAPPVDFLIKPTPKKIIILSIQKLHINPMIDIMIKIVNICIIAVSPYAITAFLFSS
jgi:hypothetical protein